MICKETKIEINESIPANVTTEILDYCLKCDPQIELTMEVKDEWFSLRELDYMRLNEHTIKPHSKTLKRNKAI